MSVDRRLLGWGIFLVLLGGVPLAVTQGWIQRDAVVGAWRLWPLVFVAIGVALILSRTPLRTLGSVLVAVTAGTMLGALVAVGVGGFHVGDFRCGAAAADAPLALSETGAFEGGSGRLALDATCAAITVSTGPGSTWGVEVRGTAEARPTIDRTADEVTVRAPGSTFVFPFGARRSTWRVDLGTDPRLDLSVQLDAGEALLDLRGASLGHLGFEGSAIGDSRLDLSAATVASLDVAVNAAALSILLPKAGGLQGTVRGNAAALDICSPPGVGLRIVADRNITASNNFGAAGLVARGDAWESVDFATAAARTELTTAGAAASFTLNPEDGCQ